MHGMRVRTYTLLAAGMLVMIGGLVWAKSGDAQPMGKMDQLEQRVADLERELALLKRSPAARPQASAATANGEMLRVEGIEIVNSKGQAVCKIDADSQTGGGRLRLFDHEGRPTMLTRCNDGGSIILFGADGKMKKNFD